MAGVLAATGRFRATTPVRACSSAGGGLRLAVVGYEELISAEAGHRAALSAGARVVHVAAGRLDDAALASCAAVAPDVVLLVGGTDGGEASVLRHNAAALAGADWSVPVVLAGNAAVRDEVAGVLRAGGLPVREADNVLPDIGRLAPESARAAIREVFLEHVIGGDRLSTDPRLRAVGAGGDAGRRPGGRVRARRAAAGAEVPGVVVLDVGGATTDVYCVPDPDAEQATLGREAVGVPARRRTVEGDLGVSWSVDDLRAAAAAEGLTAGRRPAVPRRGRRDRRAAPAPARRGGLRARRCGRPGRRARRPLRRGLPARRPRRGGRRGRPAGRRPGWGRQRPGRHAGRRRPALRAGRGRPAGRRAPGGRAGTCRSSSGRVIPRTRSRTGR